jgi:hypothetical protein
MVSLADKIIAFAYMMTYRNFVQENVLDQDVVLDIGSGSRFLKPLVETQGALYTGVEPSSNVYRIAVELHGKHGFENSMLSHNISGRRYDKIFAVTVLDEVVDKIKFSNTVKSYGDADSVFFFAVRNANFPLRRSNLVSSTIDGTQLKDLDFDSWTRLLEDNGLNVVKLKNLKDPYLLVSL